MSSSNEPGQWWWDGQAWQPVSRPAPPGQYQQGPQPPPHQQPPQQWSPDQPPPQQPVWHGGSQQPPPPQAWGQPPQDWGQPQQAWGQPQQTWGRPPQGPYPPAGPPPKRPRGLIIGIVVGALLLAIGIPAGILAWRATTGQTPAAQGQGEGKDQGEGQGEDRPKIIEPGQPVTEQTLSEVDPLAFYESVIKRQMTAPIGRLKSANYLSRDRFNDRDGLIYDVAIDHQTDKFFQSKSLVHGADDDDAYLTTCIDGEEYTWSSYSKRWQESSSSGDRCTKKPYAGSGDSVVSSGLTADQADQVIAKLRTYKGYVNAAQPTLLKTGNKAYVRQVVDLKSIILADDSYWGSAISMWSFRDAGLDPVTWPWSNSFALAAGIHMVYYLDTESLMPVAAFQEAVDVPKNPNGEAGSKQEGVTVINYSFPKALPPEQDTGESGKPLSVTLPEGWKAQ